MGQNSGLASRRISDLGGPSLRLRAGRDRLADEIKLGLRYFLVPVQQDLLGFLHRPRLSVQYRGRCGS